MNNAAKLLSLLALVAGFSSTAAAEGAFIGGEVGAKRLSFKADASGHEQVMDLGLKAGYDFDNARVYGAYHYNTAGELEDAGEYSINNVVVGADFTPASSSNPNLKGLFGAYAGYSDLDGEADGAILGVRVGGIYNFTKNHELEFGVKGEFANYGKITLGEVNGQEIKAKVKAANFGGFLGYNYKF